MASTMKAWVFEKYGKSDVLKLEDVAKPVAEEGQIVVRNLATGMNKVDVMVRTDGFGAPEPKEPKIVGYDGAGVVESVGKGVKDFKKGDQVWHAGDLNKQGSHAEFTAVDARIVSKKPRNLSWAEAAVLPLVALTAWEAIVEAFHAEKGKSLLIINGAGGLGSFTIQLAKALGLVVVATASREETVKFCKEMGADHVINHRESLKEGLEKCKLSGVDYIFNCFQRKGMLPKMFECLNVDGHINNAAAWDSDDFKDVDFKSWRMKRQKISYTMMFSRPMWNHEPEKQGKLLAEVVKLVESGKIKTTLRKKMEWKEMPEAHDMMESGKMLGKIALEIASPEELAKYPVQTVKPAEEEDQTCGESGGCIIA